MKTTLSPLAALLLLAGSALAQNASFYKTPPIFSTAPDPEKSLQMIERFGPVGIAVELHQPAFVMKVGKIEPGSPAAASGKLTPGQVIVTINGQNLKDIDPRIQLGNIITTAEAADGVIKLMVKDSPDAPAQEVVIKIPALGTFSKTWPLNCPKSDKIVRDFAEYLKKPGSDKGFGGIGMLFLLGTGEDKDLAPVRQWVHDLAGKGAPVYSWHLGYGGVPLCEYYLRTGDEAALPIIQKWVNNAVAEEYLGAWSQKGRAGPVNYGGGGGHHHAACTAVVTFLMLAKECGANIPDQTFNRVLTHFFRLAGRGLNSYGDNRPEPGFVDNGKNGNLAFAMAAAAALTPGGENSVYAGARDISALTSFYTTTFMLHGHTGGGIGELWRSAAMGLLYDKKPRQYRDFMETRRWHYELSRRYDGSFGILAGSKNYDNESWGAGYALTYIVPRKALRVTGALPTKFSKQYKLPERPWGTKADDAFDSIAPATLPDGTRPDFSNDTVAEDSGRPLLERFSNQQIDDATLRRYAHHPDHFVRLMAARKVMGLDSTRLGKPSGVGEIRKPLAMELFHSADARVRRAIIQAIRERLEGAELMTFFGQEGFDQVIGMLRDPAESWWVKDAALKLIGRFPADPIVPHVDLLTGFLKDKEWWLQEAALNALAPVVADQRCYRKVIPAIGELVRTCERWNTTEPLRWGALATNLREAGPEVGKLAAESFQKAYTGYTGTKKGPGGLDITGVYDSHMNFIAGTLASVPGGYDLLYKVAKQQFPNDSLPYDKIFLGADFDKFSPELRNAVKPIIRDRLIYEYMAGSRDGLKAEAAATRQGPFINGGAVDGLVALYRKLDVHEHEWHAFGPDLKQATWDYFTFDPPETLAHDVSVFRYRPVTFPKGMETWIQPDFDAAKAGWKQGQAPFGQYNGKALTEEAEIAKFRCRCDRPMRTLWDKEVLLMRGTFQFPALQPGHLYRLQVGSGVGIGCGDGYRIYINGKQLIEVNGGPWKGQGGSPRGAFITKEFLDQLGKGPVTLAAITFLRYGEKAVIMKPPVPQGNFSLWLEERKLPPLSEAAFQKAASVMPMLSAEWQAKQDPSFNENDPEEGRFVYDGKFLPNAKLLGDWTSVTVVPTMDEFDASKRGDTQRAPFKKITFKDAGLTDSETFIWSGDTLMDLTRYQALKIAPKTIGGTEYLFIEAGGFGEKNPVGWKSPLVVMKRAAK